jgi:hypothetical protein
MARLLIVIGIGIVLIGVFWPWLSKLPLGRLPGDIHIERGNSRFFFPITTSLLISAVVSLLMYLFGRRK